MVSSSSVTASPQAGRSPLLLIGLIVGFLSIVTFLPRMVLSASGVANTRLRQTGIAHDERFVTLARVEGLMRSGTKKDADVAGRLLDGLTSDPLLVSEHDSLGESEYEKSYSSSNLITKLARQLDSAAARAICSGAPPTPSDKVSALQWTLRARQIADALMLSPHPTYCALKTAHYLDSIAGKREAAILRACGNITEAEAVERQNALLKQVWQAEILSALNLSGLEQHESGEITVGVNSRRTSAADAEWAAQIDYLAHLYQKERVFTSQA